MCWVLVSGGCRACLGCGGGAAEALSGSGGHMGAQERAGHGTGQIGPKHTLLGRKLAAGQKRKGLHLTGWAQLPLSPQEERTGSRTTAIPG